VRLRVKLHRVEHIESIPHDPLALSISLWAAINGCSAWYAAGGEIEDDEHQGWYAKCNALLCFWPDTLSVSHATGVTVQQVFVAWRPASSLGRGCYYWHGGMVRLMDYQYIVQTSKNNSKLFSTLLEIHNWPQPFEASSSLCKSPLVPWSNTVVTMSK